MKALARWYFRTPPTGLPPWFWVPIVIGLLIGIVPGCTSTMDTEALRTKLAKADVRKAARNGSLLIGKTLRGLVQLERTETGMKLTVCNLHPEVLANGSEADCVRALAHLYDIVTE